jgi:large-conductance mechanosensitive channel
MLEELKQIRELLTPKPAPPVAEPVGVKEEFLAFVTKYKIVGLAVAFILGVYLGTLVQAFVGDFIMPIIAYVVPDATSWEAITLGPFRVGHFLGVLLTFLIVLLVVFGIIKFMKRMRLD